MPHQSMTDAAMRRWWPYAKAMISAMATLIILTADVAAREPRRAQSPEEFTRLLAAEQRPRLRLVELSA